eukprot:CAMPEP_0115031240 /NCGR_PEP_ID=MMETSP0216-20121206/38411_1 /TAXON_ID=223996 /ORGANISM="Protocruzia adherens, Strain Boccale" /LENGTH=330 /DNA_ID=CAMNT_0002408843 /DNA_START=32 /DNA_END=1024 /DNA_ORIENTATION=-
MKSALAVIPLMLLAVAYFGYHYQSDASSSDLNLRPIIAVLAQPPQTHCATTEDPNPTYTSYIAASYVKFVEGLGARAVPLLWNQSEEEILSLLDQVNGVVFPGGATVLYETDSTGKGVPTDYLKVEGLIVKTAIEKNKQGNHFPIYGICLGFQSLSLLSMEDLYLDNCLAPNIAVKQTLLGNPSRILSAAPENLVKDITTEEMVYESHHQCVMESHFDKSESLKAFWTPITTSSGPDGHVYINHMEAKDYPFYGFQYHPEKNIYEWTTSGFIPHTPEAIQWTQFLADFLGGEARQSQQKFADSKVEAATLIYNYEPIYTDNYFEQVYCFP